MSPRAPDAAAARRERKAGGVFYTPSPIVDYLVEQTLAPLCAGRSPQELAGLRVLDPACGAGAILLGVYRYLLARHRELYLRAPAEHASRLCGDELTDSERRRILCAHIFGLDIDHAAVEAARRNLRALAGDDPNTPDLAANIRCGNALVDPDIPITTADERRRINPIRWQLEFPAAAAAGGFSVVLANPPWLMAGYHLGPELEFIKRRYRTATGKFDLYYCFIEEGFRLLAPGGVLGMLVPNKFLHARAAGELRALLAGPGKLRRVIDFAEAPMFADATTYSCILLSGDEPDGTISYETLTPELAAVPVARVSRTTLGRAAWTFSSDTLSEVFAQMTAVGVPLACRTARFGTGVQSGADRVLCLTAAEVAALQLEAPLLRPVLRGRDVRRYAVREQARYLLFPYREEGGKFRVLDERELSGFPRAYAYLLAHRAQLDARVWFGRTATERCGAWFGLMYLDAADAFTRPHLLTPSLSDRANFSPGDGRLFATGTAGVTSIVPREGIAEDLHYLLAVLNSKPLSVHALGHSPAFQGGYRKFSAPYLQALPIPAVTADAASRRRHDRIVALARRRLLLADPRDGDAHDGAALKTGVANEVSSEVASEVASVEAEVDALVCEAFGLTPAQASAIDAHGPSAPRPRNVGTCDLR